MFVKVKIEGFIFSLVKNGFTKYTLNSENKFNLFLSHLHNTHKISFLTNRHVRHCTIIIPTYLNKPKKEICRLG